MILIIKSSPKNNNTESWQKDWDTYIFKNCCCENWVYGPLLLVSAPRALWGHDHNVAITLCLIWPKSLYIVVMKNYDWHGWYCSTLFMCVLCPAKATALWINTVRGRQNGRHFPDDIFKLILLYENYFISIQISLKLIPKGPIINRPSLL